MAEIELEDALVWVNGEDRNGRLAYTNGRLVGVLVELNESDGQKGKWFLEAGFGPASGMTPPVFEELTDARDWLKCRVEKRIRDGVGT
jgi:hypothetical protein